MIIDKKERILFISPHTDDAEFGCGGTISKLIDNGNDVFFLCFSFARKSLPEKCKHFDTKIELGNAIEVLGVHHKNLITFDYEVREFSKVRQHILENLVVVNKDIRPDIVFLPSEYDTHQDHLTISQEGFRCFKNKTILGYEMVWNNLTFITNLFIPISEENLNKKINSIMCYKSQCDRAYSNPEFLRSLAIVRGTQINCKYSEVFTLSRGVLR